MEDKDLMEKELLIIKGVCDLYMHGAIESSTAEVHKAFKDALNESLDIQNKIYNLMSEKGWYKTTEYCTQRLTVFSTYGFIHKLSLWEISMTIRPINLFRKYWKQNLLRQLLLLL